MVFLKPKCVYEQPGPCQNASPDSVGVVSGKLQGTLVLLLHTQTKFCVGAHPLSMNLSMNLSIYESIYGSIYLSTHPSIYLPSGNEGRGLEEVSHLCILSERRTRFPADPLPCLWLFLDLHRANSWILFSPAPPACYDMLPLTSPPSSVLLAWFATCCLCPLWTQCPLCACARWQTCLTTVGYRVPSLF